MNFPYYCNTIYLIIIIDLGLFQEGSMVPSHGFNRPVYKEGRVMEWIHISTFHVVQH